MFKKIWPLIVKEFIAVWQDKRSRMMLIGPPIMQFFIFTFAATLDVQNVSLGVLNQDKGHYSHEFIQRLKGSPEFRYLIPLESEHELKEALDTQQVLAAIQIQEDFSKNILSHSNGEIFAIADGRKSNSSQIVLGYIGEIIEAYNRELILQSSLAKPRAETISRNWYNPNLTYTWFTLTGLVGVLSMLTSIGVTALSIAREKEMGTFEQLLVSPLNQWEILIGKAIPALVIGVGEGTIMLLAGVVFLSLPVRGHLFLLYPSMVIFILSIVGIGLFISSLSRTQQQATMGVFLCLSPMIIMSGFATPIANMPIWLQYFSLLNPLKYFLIIVRGTCLKKISFITILNNVWPMLLIAFATMSFAAWYFRRQTR